MIALAILMGLLAVVAWLVWYVAIPLAVYAALAALLGATGPAALLLGVGVVAGWLLFSALLSRLTRK